MKIEKIKLYTLKNSQYIKNDKMYVIGENLMQIKSGSVIDNYYFVIETRDNKRFYHINNALYGPYDFGSIVKFNADGSRFITTVLKGRENYVLTDAEGLEGPYKSIGLFYISSPGNVYAYYYNDNGYYFKAGNLDTPLGRLPSSPQVLFINNTDNWQICYPSDEYCPATKTRYYHVINDKGKKSYFNLEPIFYSNGDVCGYKNPLNEKGWCFKDKNNDEYGYYDGVDFFKFNGDETTWKFDAQKGKTSHYVVTKDFGVFEPFKKYSYSLLSGNGNNVIINAKCHDGNYVITGQGDKSGPYSHVASIKVNKSGNTYLFSKTDKKLSGDPIFPPKGKWDVVKNDGKIFGPYERVSNLCISDDGKNIAFEIEKGETTHVVINGENKYGVDCFGLNYISNETGEYFCWFDNDKGSVFLNKLKVK